MALAQHAVADATEPADSQRRGWLTPALVYDGSALVNLRGGARTGSTFSKYMTVQPDIQYVAHPNTDAALADALVMQVLFEIAL